MIIISLSISTAELNIKLTILYAIFGFRQTVNSSPHSSQNFSCWTIYCSISLRVTVCMVIVLYNKRAISNKWFKIAVWLQVAKLITDLKSRQALYVRAFVRKPNKRINGTRTVQNAVHVEPLLNHSAPPNYFMNACMQGFQDRIMI